MVGRSYQLQSRRHGVVAGSVGFLVWQIFLRVEEKQLLLVGIELARNIDWTANIAADGVVAIAPAREALTITEKVIGVEGVVPNVVVRQAVELARARLGDDIDNASRGFSVFRLV